MTEQTPGSRVGYSDKISDPAFHPATPKESSKQTLKYLLFAVPLLVLVVLWRTDVLATWLFALLVALCVVTALPPILKERRQAEDTTYDGNIVSVERREPVSEADIRRLDAATRNKMILHTLRIRDDAGKVHTYERTGGLGEDLRTYYHPEDRVRHHKGFDLPEKYDKSGDDTVICIVCGRLNSMDSRRCTECGTVLLK